jgi:hypothetical protein
MAGLRPGHPDPQAMAFNSRGHSRTLIIEITGTSPVMTPV